MARGGSDAGAPAFQAGDALLQHRHRRIGQPRIDVAEIVQVEERGRVVDILEDIGGRLIDRRRAGARRRIGRRAGMDGAGLEAIGEIARRGRPLLPLARPRRLGRAVADDAGIDPAPGELAAQPPELDLRAAVHHHLDAGGLRPGRRRIVAHAELHPDHLGPDGDRILDDRRHLVGCAEDIDHIHRLGYLPERGIDLLAEQGLAGDAGIDGDDPVALALKIFHDEIARAVPMGRGAHHGDHAHPLQDRPQLGVAIGDRFGLVHQGLAGSAFDPPILAALPKRVTGDAGAVTMRAEQEQAP